jgi:hypothetical protein
MTDSYVPSVDLDQRHRAGAEALEYWNESFWFPIYDPKLDIGIVFRVGEYPRLGTANVFLTIFRAGRIVLALSDQLAPLPPHEPRRLGAAHGLTVEWEEPLQGFRLRFDAGAHGFDLHWKGMSPPFLYQGGADAPVELVPRHIEQGGRAVGTVRIAGESYALNGCAHRDHTFGGERDWDKMYRWNYLSGEFDESFWFNAVRIKWTAEMDWLYVGCLWDGARLLTLNDLAMSIKTADGGTRPVAAALTLTDELGRQHRIESGRIVGECPVRIWNNWLKDYLVEYRMGDRLGYGVLEHGYREGAPLAEFQDR